MKLVVFGMFVLTAAWQDLKHREIPVVLYALAFAMLFLLSFSQPDVSWGWQDMLGGLCMGAVLMILSKITEGQIGMGDALFFCVSGMALTLEQNLMLLFSALFLCSLYGFSMILSSFGKHGVIDRIQQKQIAFLPFLIPGVVFLLIGEAL